MDDYLDLIWVGLMSLLMFVTVPVAGWIVVFALGLYGLLSLAFALSEVYE